MERLQERQPAQGAFLQAKCACGGSSASGECEECRDQRQAQLQRKPIVPSDPPHTGHDFRQIQLYPSAPILQRAAEDTAAPAVPARAAAAGFIVEDDAPQVGPGQMRKSDFLSQLRTSVCATADGILVSTGRSTSGCPYLDRWFDYYYEQDAAHVERSLHLYAPEAARAGSARDYIPMVSSRIGHGVEVWATTGQITGVPEELAGALPGGGVLGAVGSVLSGVAGAVSSVVEGIGDLFSGIGSLFSKGQEGGAREAANPLAIQSRLGPGGSLGGSVRSQMESAFGHDFSRVRVHADGVAAGLSANLNARAFTIGSDIAFAAGEYRPGSLIGDALLAHELAHVVQQSGGAAPPEAMQKGSAGYDSLEEEADLSAVNAVVSTRGGEVSQSSLPQLRSGLRLQRCGGASANLPGVETVAAGQDAMDACTGSMRLNNPASSCCTASMLGEIHTKRNQAGSLVANAVNKLRPENIGSVEAQLQNHFRISPGDAAVDSVRSQFAAMDRTLRSGSIEFWCRDRCDSSPCDPVKGVRAASNNCSNGTGRMNLCAWYPDPHLPDICFFKDTLERQPGRFLDPSYLHTFIHESAHLACPEAGRIYGVGQETYYRGTFPGTSSDAIHNADAYAGFAEAVQ